MSSQLKGLRAEDTIMMIFILLTRHQVMNTQKGNESASFFNIIIFLTQLRFSRTGPNSPIIFKRFNRYWNNLFLELFL